MPEWLKGADCKSAGLPTLVQIQLGPFIYLVIVVLIIKMKSNHFFSILNKSYL